MARTCKTKYELVQGEADSRFANLASKNYSVFATSCRNDKDPETCVKTKDRTQLIVDKKNFK